MTKENTAGVPAQVTQAVLEEVRAAAADETVSFLRELVNFRTENPNLVNIEPGAEAECQAFIADKLKVWAWPWTPGKSSPSALIW